MNTVKRDIKVERYYVTLKVCFFFFFNCLGVQLCFLWSGRMWSLLSLCFSCTMLFFKPAWKGWEHSSKQTDQWAWGLTCGMRKLIITVYGRTVDQRYILRVLVKFRLTTIVSYSMNWLEPLLSHQFCLLHLLRGHYRPLFIYLQSCFHLSVCFLWSVDRPEHL